MYAEDARQKKTVNRLGGAFTISEIWKKGSLNEIPQETPIRETELDSERAHHHSFPRQGLLLSKESA